MVDGHQVGNLTPTFLFAWSGPWYMTSRAEVQPSSSLTSQQCPLQVWSVHVAIQQQLFCFSLLTLIWMDRKVLGRLVKKFSPLVWLEGLVIVTAELILAPTTFHRRLNVLKMKNSVSQHFFFSAVLVVTQSIFSLSVTHTMKLKSRPPSLLPLSFWATFM